MGMIIILSKHMECKQRIAIKTAKPICSNAIANISKDCQIYTTISRSDKAIK